MNAILGFVLDALAYLPLRYIHVGAGWHLSPANASLAYALAVTLGCWILLWPLYRARVFVKV
jgi:predicted acyltransferase